MIVFTIISIGQFVPLFFYNNLLGLDYLIYIGYGFWILSAIFGIVPIIYFKIKGGVKKGQSYIKTTKLVTSGPYAIVRHPQYVALNYMAIAITLFTQSWINVLTTVLIIIFNYWTSFQEEQSNIEKFGDEYREYRKRVPRFYLLYGFLKFVIRKIKKHLEKKEITTETVPDSNA
jgi:protein-S-isoprenylcysteine O-methyltransferase Ste14